MAELWGSVRETAADRKKLIEDRVNVNWGVQDRHSDTFDNIAARRVGNQYATHPLEGQTWPE